ncbi:unnamed protein product [Pleuronectes platessa]|uniref:Uncharacterized protein n=1 Tax=Pleuronectes platessa TaxID=8262 RepID=A0A9N7UDF8_PLEPL|nr:unnamed protein product [Pleuronectes platessa]
MDATLCTSPFCALSCPRYDVDPSLQPITANSRLMLKGKLLVDRFFERDLYVFTEERSGGKEGKKQRVFTHRIPLRRVCCRSSGISPPSPQPKTTGN